MVDFLRKGQIHNKKYYSNLLTTLREKVVETKGKKFSKGVLFLQGNAPAHKSRIAMNTIHDLGFKTLDHPPYL